jgi:mannose-6-phosphate isomerase
VDTLQTTIRPYAWGSRTALAHLQGRPVPSPGPEAELWAGAHPGAPSRVVRDGRTVTLDRVLAADPVRELGPEVVAEFGACLPFLLKVLAVDAPLSLQAHPDAEQARVGFAAEEAAGVPRAASHRNYKDGSPKPELVCAVTPFEALCGFRAVPETVRLLDHLLGGWGVEALAPYAAPLREDGAAALREVVTALLCLDGPGRDRLVDAVGEACVKAADGADGPADARTYARIADLAERHPGDPGVVVALLLNHVWLEPGEAFFVPAGSLHAYLGGVGVEVMANSDNTLRGGLTGKHVDREALLGVLRFDAGPIRPVPAVDTGDTRRWPTPAREFALERIDVAGPVALPAGRPQILLCMAGTATVEAGGAAVELGSGGAVFLSASDPAATVTGRGLVFRAAPGL